MVGVYVHIPFCKSRCIYCDFFSTTMLNKREEYVQAVIREAEQRITNDAHIHTIYFGGGTPSMLSVDQLTRVLKAIHPSKAKEITIEANPGDLNVEKLSALRQAGFNRLSIGVQSFRDEELRFLGRRHTAEEARQAVRWAQEAGFENISIDLMYALPNQTMASWQYSIGEALKLNVQHISCYCLTYEPDTQLDRLVREGQVKPADEETENSMYDVLCEVLKSNGYTHYEVSNFARPGYYSQHNSSYWNNTPYIGLGAGAHSYDGRTRRANTADLSAYLKRVSSGEQYWEEERLTEEQKHMEQIMLGLRTNEGICPSEETLRKAKMFLENGQLGLKDGRLVATQSGLHILNYIIETLV